MSAVALASSVLIVSILAHAYPRQGPAEWLSAIYDGSKDNAAT